MLRAEKGSMNQEKKRRLEKKLKMENDNGVAGIKEKIKAIKVGIKELKSEKGKKSTLKQEKQEKEVAVDELALKKQKKGKKSHVNKESRK